MSGQEIIFEHNSKKYKVIRPTNKIRRDSDAIYAKSYREALANGFLLQAEIDEILESRGFSNQKAEDKRTEYLKKIRKLEAKLVNNDYANEVEGKKLAFELQDLRDGIANLNSARTELEMQSVERQAENKRFNYFAYRCCMTIDGNLLWSDFDEFESDDSPLALQAAGRLLLLTYNINQDAQKDIIKDRVESKWLKKHNFVDDEIRLINDSGLLIDRHGRRVNEDGSFIDDDGNRIDIFGNKIDDDGQLVFIENIASKSDVISKSPRRRSTISKKKSKKSVIKMQESDSG